MDATEHAMLIQIYFVLTYIIFSSLLICLALSESPGFLVVLGLDILLYLTIWSWLPVHCSTPGCMGRNHHTVSKLSFFKVRIVYRCSDYDETYQADIFAPGYSDEGSGDVF